MESKNNTPLTTTESTSKFSSPLLSPTSKGTPSLSTESEKPAYYEGEMDEDEISQQMTQSYSEISFKSDGLSPENDIPLSLTLESISLEEIKERPMTLFCDRTPQGSKPLMPLNLEGSVHIEGNMTHFVTEDLEHKIRLSSPVTKKDLPSLQGSSRNCTPSPLYRQLLEPQVGQLDTAFINDLECEAQRMATSIDNLIENLCGILHSISSITADNVDVYKNAVSKMSDAMDSNIKSMYTMMAKAEEVTESMKTIEVYAARIKDIKKLLDFL